MNLRQRTSLPAKSIGFGKSDAVRSVFSSVLCIFIGIFVGFLFMLAIAAFSEDITLSDAWNGLVTILVGPFASGSSQYIITNFGDMVFYAAPLIMTGLSVAVAFKTGLFNIGAAGQFFMGAMGSLLVALSIPTTGHPAEGILVWTLALLVGCLCGMLWGAIPGLFKAFFNVNEVIVCIMTNWIAANLVSWVFSECPQLINTGGGKSGYLITTAQTGNAPPTIGLDTLFEGSYIDISIVLAVVLAVFLYILMNKTTFGYELKACGYNKNAAQYAGMSEKRNMILSMAIAGGLAALGGAFYYLNPGIELKFSSAYMKLPDYGFNGIPVALLASNNPLGVIASGLFLRFLGQGGDNLVSAGYNRYIADIIIAIIIYFSGFSKYIRDRLEKRKLSHVPEKEGPAKQRPEDGARECPEDAVEERFEAGLQEHAEAEKEGTT